MPKVKLTKSYIDSLAPGALDQLHHDTEVSGFQLKMTPAGRKVFQVYYRNTKGQQRRHKIGQFGDLTVQQARELARRIKVQVAAGGDPSLERRQARNAPQSDRVDDIVETFLEKHARQNRSYAETERIFRREVLPKLGRRRIDEVSKSDAVVLLDQIVARGSPTMANRILAALRKFGTWCVGRGIIESSPFEGIHAPTKEKSRDRVLSDEELARVLGAARSMNHPYGRIIELLALTGQRRDEVTSMRWSNVDLQARLWTIPGEQAKNAKPHDVHLSAAVLDVLKACPRHAGTDYVFTTNGRTPFQGFAKAKARLDKLSSVQNWRHHDLRRTTVSGMARLGAPPHIADKVINHKTGTISSVAAIYQRHEFAAERRDALDRWAAHVQGLLVS